MLGCTELSLAIKSCDVSVPIFNTTQIHIDEICRSASALGLLEIPTCREGEKSEFHCNKIREKKRT